jgi:ATP-dependent DNA ligase
LAWEKNGRARIARSCGLPVTNIQARFARSGDLGEVAAALLARRGSGKSIGRAFETLRNITQASGAGAQPAKVETLAKLLSEVSPVEAKYIVRALYGHASDSASQFVASIHDNVMPKKKLRRRSFNP